VAFQLVRDVLAVLDEVAALPTRNADPVVAGELVLGAEVQVIILVFFSVTNAP
jgi:hypothetical protein